MNRNEAIKKQEALYPYGYSTLNVKLINKIYDDFESRTCKSCKHNKSCETLFVLLENISIPAHLKDFGCNKWEPNV